MSKCILCGEPKVVRFLDLGATVHAFDRDPDIYVKLVNQYKIKGDKTKEIRKVLARGHRLYPTDMPIYRLYREAFGTN